jgi:hypothetical protein
MDRLDQKVETLKSNIGIQYLQSSNQICLRPIQPYGVDWSWWPRLVGQNVHRHEDTELMKDTYKAQKTSWSLKCLLYGISLGYKKQAGCVGSVGLTLACPATCSPATRQARKISTPDLIGDDQHLDLLNRSGSWTRFSDCNLLSDLSPVSSAFLAGR